MKKKNEVLYKKIKKDIEEKIEKGEYKQGDKIPSILELSRQYKVSEITIRQAVGELIREGILEGKVGKGTFVIGKKIKEEEKLVGVIFTDIVGNPFFSEIFAGIESILLNDGFHSIVGVSYNNIEKEKRLIKDFIERNVKGIILTPTEVNRSLLDNEIINEAIEKNFSIVFVDRKIEGIESDYVSSDNIEGGYIATKYLISLGHKRIGFILGINVNTVRERLEGYKKALSEAEIPFDPLLIKRSYVELQYEESGYRNTIELLNLKEPPTAIFACNDLIAVGVYKACYKLGIKIPDDISVIGYDNLSFVSSLNPSLTTINQKTRDIGENAAKILLNRIKGDKSATHKILLPVQLIERNSCKKIKETKEVRI